MSMSRSIRVFLYENSYFKFKNFLKRKKKSAVHPINKRRRVFGEFHHLFSELKQHPERFYAYFRMTSATFEYILYNIDSKIRKKFTNAVSPIKPVERLAVTVRFLATGCSFRALAMSFRMGVSTVSGIIKEVCQAIWEVLLEKHMPAPSETDLVEVARNFFNKWDFPHCIGCIDGKHIRCKCPPNSGSLYFNYKQFFSIVLQAVADANYKFIAVEVGAYGKQSDGGIFELSTLHYLIENKKYPIPRAQCLPNSALIAPFVMLGDEAYPLRSYLLRPFSKSSLDADKICFNDNLSRARKVVECAFGIITSKWRILTKAFETDVKTTEVIVKSICLLHNIIADRKGIAQPVTFELAENSGNGLQETGMEKRYNAHSRAAGNTREIFKEYFKLKKN